MMRGNSDLIGDLLLEEDGGVLERANADHSMFRCEVEVIKRTCVCKRGDWEIRAARTSIGMLVGGEPSDRHPETLLRQ